MLIPLHGVKFNAHCYHLVKLYAHCDTWSGYTWSEAMCSLVYME